jgi:hypothetical protein
VVETTPGASPFAASAPQESLSATGGLRPEVGAHSQRKVRSFALE